MPNVDRRVIYVVMIVAVVYAFVRPMGLPITISDYTRTAHAAIDSLAPGSVLVMGMDFSAGGIPELEPAGKAILYHCLQNDVRVVMIGMWIMAGDIGERLLAEIAPMFPAKSYGADYVNIGYKPGGGLLLERATHDIIDAASDIDHRGQVLSGMQLFESFRSLRDASMWVCLSTGNPGVFDWIKVVGDPLGIPGVADVISVSIPENMPFIQSGQLAGIIQGMRGAAEYELLIKRPDRAVAGMDAQSLAHVVILFFVLLGNIAYLTRRRGEKA